MEALHVTIQHRHPGR